LVARYLLEQRGFGVAQVAKENAMLSNRLLSGCVAAIALGVSALGAAAAPHGVGMGGGGFQGGGGGLHGGGGGFHGGGVRGNGGGVRFYGHPRAFRGGYIGDYYGYGYGNGCYWNGRWHRWVCPGY
jgi:hypothetical protein